MVAMLVGVVVVPAVPASATSSWSVVPSASPPAPPHAQLFGMSCPTSTSCFAVGSTYFQRLIERWNGTAWSLFPPPPGEQYISAQLLSVSCVSASDCFAVGSTSGGSTSGLHPRVEHWNGTAWTNTSTSTSASALPSNSVLRGVSCVSATFCVAVGEDLSGGGTRGYLAQWDGSQWSIVATPGGSLRGVSCSATNFCVAVGFDPNSHVTAGFRWNGTAWTTMATLNPSGTSHDSLQAVVCRSTTLCVAVGQADSRTLIERWNGTTWSVMSSPNAANFAKNQLFGVSCPSDTRCFATGARDKRTLIAQWDGTTWSLDTNAPFRTGSLINVSCASTARCAAAGANTSEVADSSTGIEQYDGTSWTVAPPPAGSSYSALAAVGCAGGTVCFAVGSASSTTTGTLSTLAERWNGTAWVTTPSPSPSDGAVLADVGCGTTTSCIAVGSTVPDRLSATKAVIEHWDGNSWTMTSYPVPPNTTSSTLTSVSCTSATFCMAVGTVTTFDTTHVDTPLIERWNGSTWSRVTPAATSGGTGGTLQSVSCTSTAFCLAVDLFGGLAERWNGSTWIQVTGPGVGASIAFAEVSCVSGTMCFAVGQGSADPNGAVAVRWNGNAWSITPTASIPNAGVFNGVKCLSGTNCYAVGRVVSPATTLVEHWDGANWSLVPSPIPTGSVNSKLSDVACPSATTCHAVGDFARRTDGAIDYTLAERLA
jgi:hypothetical protein